MIIDNDGNRNYFLNLKGTSALVEKFVVFSKEIFERKKKLSVLEKNF